MQTQADPAPKARFSKLAIVSVLPLPALYLLLCLPLFAVCLFEGKWPPFPSPAAFQWFYYWWLGGFWGCFLFWLGPTSILASIVIGHIAQFRIGKSRGLLRGEGLAMSVYILGYLTLFFLVITFDTNF